jgi:hypothetical protein
MTTSIGLPPLGAEAADAGKAGIGGALAPAGVRVRGGSVAELAQSALDTNGCPTLCSMTSPAADRIPEIVRRYLATEVEDYEARAGPVGDLEAVLENIAWTALQENDALDPGAVTDDVSIDSLSTADQKLECEGMLWFLDGGSWSVPISATFWLTPDLRSVTGYVVKIADPSHEARSGSGGAVAWTVIVRSGEVGSQEGSSGS